MSGTDQIVQHGLSREGLNDFQSKWLLVVTWHNRLGPLFEMGLIDADDLVQSQL